MMHPCVRGASTPFNEVDDFNCEILAIEVPLNLTAAACSRCHTNFGSKLLRAICQKLRMDNGPEFISVTLAEWTENKKSPLECIKPEKFTQNAYAYMERFNRASREALLNMYTCKNFTEVKKRTED